MNLRQSKILHLKKHISACEKSIEITYYSIKYNEYSNIQKYLNLLDNIYDKISLAQWAYNFNDVDNLILNLNMSTEELNKYNKLLSLNIELNKTINFEILTAKYNFLGDMLEMITTDIDIQQQIIGLSNNELKLFKKLYKKLESLTDYKITLIEKMLKTIGNTPFLLYKNNNKYQKLINELCLKIDDYTIKDKELEKLLYLFTKTDDFFDITTVEELESFNSSSNNKYSIEIDNLINQEINSTNKNIENIKTALLLKTYGITYDDAMSICKEYDITNLEITCENKDIIEMYTAILRIYLEVDADLLIDIYKDFNNQMSPSFDCLRILLFEKELQKAFAKDYNNKIYKPINLENIIDGVNIYDAGTNFKMLVTAIGSYQKEFKNQENYSAYWNSPYIMSHSNSCSLISNNNLAMAPIKNIVLGFNNMNSNMLLLCNSYDMNTTDISKNFDISTSENKCFMTAENLIKNTRNEYNELVYERRDLDEYPIHYKKNPSYIVFFEDYENIDDLIKNEKKENERNILLENKLIKKMQWDESLKAAKDFNIPIVKINKEKCAKNELNKILNNLDKYKNTFDSQLIENIIIEFENNRIGNSDKLVFIRNKYFSKDIMHNILSEIYETIYSIDNIVEKNRHLDVLNNIVIDESKRYYKNRWFKTSNQTIGFDENEIFKNIEILKGGGTNKKSI